MKFLASLIFFLLLLTSCIKDKVEITEIDSSISPEFGVALVKARISAQDVIERYDDDGIVETGNNEILTLVYRDSLEPISANEFLSLSDQSLSESIELSQEQQDILSTAGGSVSISSSDVYELDFGQDRLDSIRFSSGVLEIGYTVPTGFTVSGTVQLIDPTNQDVLLEASLENQGSGSITTNIELENRLIRFVTDQVGGITNGIQFNFFVDVQSQSSSGAPSVVGVDFDLTDFSIRSIGGFIAPRTYSIEEQSTDIDLYETDFEGEIILENPRLNLFLISDYGIDVRPVLTRVEFFNDDVEIGSIVESDIQQLPVIQGADFIGDEGVSEVVIDNDLFVSSSDLTDFLQLRPDSVTGRFDLDINPNSVEQNFIAQDSRLNIEFEVELPIYGSLSNFTISDTTDIDLGDVVESADDIQEIEQLDIRLFVKNALPVEAGVQIIFLDSTFNRIDSLFTEPTVVIPAAPVDLSPMVGSPNYGRVIGESETTIDISIPRERIDPLEDVTQVIVSVFGNTTGNGGNPIRLYPENFIEVNLAAKAVFNLELE